MGKVNITKLREWLDESIDELSTSYEEARRAFKYYNGKQLPSDVLRVLKERGQPPIWDNVIREIANKLTGFHIIRKNDLRARGRQKEDIPGARIMTDVIKFVMDDNNFDQERVAFRKNLSLAGFAGYEMRLEPSDEEFDSDGDPILDIKLKAVPYDELFIDPFSREKDYSDAKYLHRAFWVDREELYEHFPEELVDQVPSNDATDLRAREGMRRRRGLYAQQSRDRIFLVNTWYRVGKKFYYAFWAGNTILQDGESPYMNGKGYPYVIKRFEYETDEPEIVTMFRDILPIQDAINFALIKIQNLFGTIKAMVEKGAVDDIEKFEDELNTDGAVVEVNDIQRVKVDNLKREIQSLANHIINLQIRARQLAGINDEFAGVATNARTGAAIQSRQDAAIVSIQSLIDAADDSDRQVGMKLVRMIQAHYTQERVIRVIDSLGKEEFIALNQQTNIFKNGEYENTNDLSMGRYDIVIEQAPPTTVNRQEILTQYTEMLKTVLPLGALSPEEVRLVLADYMRNLDLPISGNIVESLSNNNPAVQGNNPPKAGDLLGGNNVATRPLQGLPLRNI